MFYNIISKSFGYQLSLNFNLFPEICENINSYLNINKNEYCIDILLNKNINKLQYYKKNCKPFIVSIPYEIIDHDYHLLSKTLNTFLFLFKRDIITALHNNKKLPYITINQNNNEWLIFNNLIKHKTISINTILYKNKINYNIYYIFIQINWRTTKLIYYILYKNAWEYVLNYYQLYNNLNEVVNIEYTTKIKNKNIIKGKKKNKKKQILNFLKLFLDNFYIKLTENFIMPDTTHNFFDISGINKTHLYLNLYIKMLNNNSDLSILDNMHELHTHNEILISVINNNIKKFFIDKLHYIL